MTAFVPLSAFLRLSLLFSLCAFMAARSPCDMLSG